MHALFRFRLHNTLIKRLFPSLHQKTEVMTMGYGTQSIPHELEVIDFLLHAGKINREEARYLRDYVESLV